MGRQRDSSSIEILILVVICVVAGFFFGEKGWNLYTNKTFTGVIKKVENITPMYSDSETGFSFSVKMDVGDKYITFSSDDRQFGSCEDEDSVRVRVFQYPPWNITKSGTFHGGRLLESYKRL